MMNPPAETVSPRDRTPMMSFEPVRLALIPQWSYAPPAFIPRYPKAKRRFTVSFCGYRIHSTNAMKPAKNLRWPRTHLLSLVPVLAAGPIFGRSCSTVECSVGQHCSRHRVGCLSRFCHVAISPAGSGYLQPSLTHSADVSAHSGDHPSVHHLSTLGHGEQLRSSYPGLHRHPAAIRHLDA